MAAFAPATDKIVTSSTGNLTDAVPLDARDMLSRLLIDMGLLPLVVGNTPPSNRDDLWWHKDVRQVKRYDGVLGNWYQATPNQIAMHIARRAVLGSVTEISLETGDLFTFWDVSQGDVKVITRDSLMAALGSLRTIATTEGIQGGGTLGANRTFRLDVNGLSGKSLPAGADKVPIYSVADSAHRSATVTQIAAGIASSDYLHSETFFLGMM
jgi:hypothetical protein